MKAYSGKEIFEGWRDGRFNGEIVKRNRKSVLVKVWVPEWSIPSVIKVDKRLLVSDER